LPKERTLEIFRAVDKLGKIGVEGVREELAKIGASLKASNKLLELSSLKGKPKAIIEEAQKTLEGSKNGLSGCEALSSIVEYSTLFGIEPYMAIDFSLARGLDYYTGPVFEIYAEGFEDYGSIAGGGRYDELIGLFGGKSTPATGVSLGIERIFTLLEKRTAFEGLVLGPRVYVASTSESVRGKAIEVAQILRRADISTDLDMMGRSLKRQLDYANNKGFKKVVIVGERELANGQVSLKDMRTSEQRIIKIEDLKDKLLHE
jgi:histidyl-tRNA synthetase